MKIIYMGTPDFAVGPLKALIGAGHDVVCVLTRADKPKGRGHAVQFSPVKEAALEAGIPVLQPVRMKDPELWKTLEDYGADLFVVAAYGRILPKEILSIPKYGCVNIHASLLPDYRGAAPIQWAVIDGRKESGVTTMLMNEGLDTGDILRQYRITLADNETGGSLFDKLAALGSEAILDTVKGLEDGSIVPVKQEETTTPYAAMLTKEMGLADWSKDAETLERLIRGLDPWPGVYSYLDGKMLKLWKAEVLPEGGSDAAPGTILSVKNGLAVQTGKGALRMKKQGKDNLKYIKMYIRLHLADDLSLTALSRLVCLSPNYMCMLFRESEGMSLGTFIEQSRMQRAAYLLITEDSQMQEIAARVGYRRVSYFCRAFKSYYGCTPRTYRYAHRAEEI